MARLSIFVSFAKSKLFVCFAAFVCVLLSAAAFAKSDPWRGCRGGDLEARIAGCTEVIAHGSRETKRNQLTGAAPIEPVGRHFGMRHPIQCFQWVPENPRIENIHLI